MKNDLLPDEALEWSFLGKKLDLNEPKVMGILNVTPDSFFDGGKFKNDKTILTQVEKLMDEGAAVIDVGGYSTRPGAIDISIEGEINRTASVVSGITKAFPESIISIDTFRSEVARVAVDNGATIVNDVSGGMLDDKMYKTVGELGTPYVLMHMRGTPQNMHEHTNYENLVYDIVNYFSTRINDLKIHGVERIFLDPGFGFAKTVEQNYEIIEKLTDFGELKLPLLIGVSRKSMIWKKLNISPEQALNGTTALNAVAVARGAKLLRVHDVKEAVETIKLVKDL